MKAMSENKIVDLIHQLEMGYFRSIDDADRKNIVDTLKDVMTCEQAEAKTKVGSIDLQKYTDEKYPGVLHQEGRMIATDGKHVIALKAEYPDELEGKATGADGKETSSFPRWKSVIPNVEGWKSISIDFKRLAELVTEARAHKKIYKKDHIARVMITPEVCFDLWRLDKFARVMQYARVSEAHYQKPRDKYTSYPLTVKTEELIAVLMPCMPPEEDQKDKPELFIRSL